MTERRIEPELLDTAPDAEAALNLADIAFLNRWMGGHAVLRERLGEFVDEGEAFHFLDVGAASGDVGREVLKRYPLAHVYSLDRMQRNLKQAADPRVVADAFALPFADRSLDFVHCALFLHHFREEEIVALLKEMARCARRAVIVNDLERHPVAHGFLPWTRWLFRWNEVTLHDGPVSVAAGFEKRELRALAELAGLEKIDARSHVPWFRLSLTARAMLRG